MNSKITNALIGASTGLLAACLIACAQCSPTTLNTVNTVLSDVDRGCVAEELLASVIPAGTPISVIANVVTAACQIDICETPAVEAFVSSWVGAAADAGTLAPAGSRYVMGPRGRALFQNDGGH